eukprot:COSAG02_NODE_15440_length_1171_cov_1.438433_2_plen_290_part_01
MMNIDDSRVICNGPAVWHDEQRRRDLTAAWRQRWWHCSVLLGCDEPEALLWRTTGLAVMSRRRSSGARPLVPPSPSAAKSRLPVPADDGLPSPSSARRSPQLHPITGEPPSKRKAAARSLRPLQPLNQRPGSAGQLASPVRGQGHLDGSHRRRPSSAQPSSPQEPAQVNDLMKLYAAQVTYTQERDRRTNASDDAARQEAARVAAAAVQAAREAAASQHVDLVRQHHAASVIQSAERCRVKCDAYIEMRWAAAMIQRVERGRRARRRRRILEEPWAAPGMGMAAGLMPTN